MAGAREAHAFEVEVDGRMLRLTNLERVLYPETGFTKGEVIDYYARVAPAILPHLRSRPLTLRRFPDGVEGPSRYEKCCPEDRPDWLRVVGVWSSGREEELPFCVVDELPSLLWSANLANLELHPMLSAAPELDRPTVMAFDLDPGAPAGLLEAVDAALLLRRALDGMGLRSFPKTSGGKGLQVFVPLNTPVAFGETKRFARTVAETLAARVPERMVAKVTRSLRAGKVLIDWGQNGRHKSIVCAYSLRARAQPTVSMPIEWDELDDAAGRGDASTLAFSPRDALERLERQGDLFEPVLRERQPLPPL